MKEGGKGGNGQQAGGGARPAVLSLSIKEKAALYAAYALSEERRHVRARPLVPTSSATMCI